MFSGDGFAGMHFNVEAVPPDQFKAWVDETRNSGGKTLDSDAYKELVQAEHQTSHRSSSRTSSRTCSRRS